MVLLVYLRARVRSAGPVPADINKLVNLEKLMLPENELQGLPSEIGDLVELTHLGLSGNQIAWCCWCTYAAAQLLSALLYIPLMLLPRHDDHLR